MQAIAPEASSRARQRPSDPSYGLPARLLIALALGLGLALPANAPAQDFPHPAQLSAAQAAQVAQAAEDPYLVGQPHLLYSPTATTPRLYGTSYRLAPRWKASYGLGLAHETSLSSTFLNLDERSRANALSARGSRENWRHFLGLEFQPLAGFSLVGGFAKSSGANSKRDIAPAPARYERLRLNGGARWRGAKWGMDGTFSFIPTGPRRLPRDASFFPGTGGAGPTWLFALSVSRRF